MTRKIFFVACCVLSPVIMGACGSINLGRHMDRVMNAKYLNNSFETKPIDLAAAGQCPGTRVLKVVNTETKKGETIIYDAMGQKFFIIPYEFNQYVVKYMEEKLRESKLTVDETTGKEIDVSIEKIKVELSAGGFAFWAWAELKISLAEINYTQIYFGNEGSGAANNAVAYAVHFAVQHFLEDPVVQKYFQCRN